MNVSWLLPLLLAADAPPAGFEALLGFDRLPLLADWPAFQDSSYHRGDINQDAGNFLRVEPNGDQVLVDTDGPGVIYRIWSTGVVGTQMSDACRLRLFFDGEEMPRLDLSIPELFGGKGSRWPFVSPLAETFESGAGAGEGPCNLSYVPIPFARHLKIVGRKVMFYHVDYHKLPAGAPVESFSQELAERHRPILEEAARILERIPRRPGADMEKVWECRDRELPPGGEAAHAIEGEGMLGAIEVKLAEPTPTSLRGVVIEVAFEKERAKCVRVPLGDFFGSGCGDRRFRSLPCGMEAGGYYSYWPMPFRERAGVIVRNETAAPVKLELLRVGYRLGPQPPGAGYFHARYVQDRDIPLRRDYRILEVAGRGKFVGTNVTMQNARGAQGIFFLEGDEKIYVDGEKYPSRWLGTGTEDYFNGAYFWNAPDKARMARPHGGLTFLDWGIGRVCAYRWHVLDWIGFTKEIRVDLEHGGVSDSPASYQSVAYYYLERPAAQPELPLLAERLPRTPLPPAPRFLCCELAAEPLLAGRKLEKRPIASLDPEFESSDAILHGRGKAGERLEATLHVPGEDEFAFVLHLAGGPEFARVAVALDGKRLGEVDARKPAFTPWLATEFGPLRLAGGEHRLALELEAEGPDTPERAVGLVAVQLKPRSRFIDRWSVIGNWPCPKEGGWEAPHEPEASQDLAAVYRLPGGGEARWQPRDGEHVGLAGGDWLVAYGLTYIHSPAAGTVACFIGKDDALKIWVNGESVFDQNTWSHATHDQFYTTLRLEPGWNKVLVKSANWFGGWGFALRPGDPDRKLRFARRPQDLPRVLIIGDSISMGYAPHVASLLGDAALVERIEPNGGDSANVLAHLGEWTAGKELAVVLFNCGLHDLKYSRDKGSFQQPLEAYEKNLRAIVERARTNPGTAWIWATTTPVIDERHARRGAGFDRREADVRRYNEAAARVIAEARLPVADLHAALTAAGVERLVGPDGVHLTEEGYKLLARRVAEAVTKALPPRK